MERHQAEGKFNVMLPVIRLHGESSDSLRILLFILAVRTYLFSTVVR